jgi:surfeit locus 1 family protein
MTGRDLVLGLATLGALALTARLGVWQLDRADQKIRLQSALEQRGDMPPLTLTELARNDEEAEAQTHRQAQVSGTWLPQHTVHLDNRQMNGLVGFVVLTPLQLSDGTAIVVQRGWRPRDFQDRTRLTPVPTPQTMVTLRGRLARSPARLYEFEAAASGPIRQNLNLEAFAQETGLPLRPVTLLQTSASPEDGLQRDWPRPAADVHKHYGYAFQWFALCALIGGLHVWFRIIRPRRARIQAAHPSQP